MPRTPVSSRLLPTRGVVVAMLSGLIEWFALQRARLAGPLR